MRIAVFDLDGTVTRHDTLVPYLRGWLRRYPRRGWPGPALVALVRAVSNGLDRGRLKSDLIRACMGGAGEREVRAWSTDFAARIRAEEIVPGASAALARHREAGDRLVLLSASVDLYVPDIGRSLGFHETICTGVAWRDGRLEGSLTTANRRADEKRRCIDGLRRQYPASHIAAYANAGSDLAHLSAVDEPLLVNAGGAARRAARRLGIPVGDWRNKPAAHPVQSA